MNDAMKNLSLIINIPSTAEFTDIPSILYRPEGSHSQGDRSSYTHVTVKIPNQKHQFPKPFTLKYFETIRVDSLSVEHKITIFFTFRTTAM